MKIHILWVLYSYYHQNTVLYNTLVLGVPIFLGTSSTKRWRPGDFTIEAVVSYPVYRGGTPLNNPPIEKHTNSSMFALIF